MRAAGQERRQCATCGDGLRMIAGNCNAAGNLNRQKRTVQRSLTLAASAAWCAPRHSSVCAVVPRMPYRAGGASLMKVSTSSKTGATQRNGHANAPINVVWRARG